MKACLIVCSWPAYLTKTQQASFAAFARRNERGLYLESYSQHIGYYRAAVTSFLVAIAVLGLVMAGTIIVSVTAFQPVQTKAKGEASGCTDPYVVLTEPVETIYCLTGETFFMGGYWHGTGGCGAYTHSLYWTYSTNVMNDTDTALRASNTPHLSVDEDEIEYEEITCQDTGRYYVKMMSELPRYSAELQYVVVNPPTAPTNLTQSTTTATSVRFTWTDNSNNEERFRIQRQSNVNPQTNCDAAVELTTTGINYSYYNNTSLAANTGYCYQVRAENGNGNTDYTETVKMYTLPLAPSVTPDRTTLTWYNTPNFQFSNAAGWNEGGVRYYRYVWDTSPVHDWTDTETLWSEAENDCPPFDGGGGSCGTAGNSLTKSAVSDSNAIYLHVRSYNYGGANNGSQDYGPFYYDATAPTSVGIVSDGTAQNETDWTNNASTFSGTWNASTDNLSGLQKYQYALGTSAGGSDVVPWTDNGTSTVAAITSLTLQNGQKYYLSARAVDAAGNTSSAVTSDGVTVDTAAATASNVVTAPSRTSAKITWTTDESATTQLEWGTTEAYGNLTTDNGILGTTHSVTLTGLNENTSYHFRIRGTDRAGNATTGPDSTFTTTEVEPTIITNTASEVLSTTSVRITWTTNHSATSRVRYGLTTAYGSEVSSTSLVTEHSLTLTGLTPGLTYHYEVLSVGNTSTNDADATFTMFAATTLSDIEAESIDANSAVITWKTSHGATSRVDYGTTTAYGLEATESELTTAHSILLTSLEAETIYHYKVTSIGNSTVASADNNFTTLAEEPVKPPPSGKVITPTVLTPKSATATIKFKPVISGLAHSGDTILVYIDNIYNGKTQTTTHSSGTGSFAYTPYLDLKPGWHSVFVKAEDVAGKKSAATKIIKFKIETPYVPPTIIRPEVHDGANPTIIINGVAKNNSTIQVLVDGAVIKEFSVNNSPSGTASFQCSVSTDSGLGAGKHSVTLLALDKNGKASKATDPITFTKTDVVSTATKKPTISFGEDITYTVQSGDSLWKIAQKYIGQGVHYDDIVWANRAQYPSLITNPGYILPGWKIFIPAIVR